MTRQMKTNNNLQENEIEKTNISKREQQKSFQGKLQDYSIAIQRNK